MILQRSPRRWQHPATQVRHRGVMDLGLRSDPNLHRAYRGPFRVRIEAWQGVGGAGKTSGKRLERIEIYVGDRNLKGKVVGEQAHTQPAACLPSAQGKLELPAAARKSDLPLSRFPLRGKAGAGGFPPRRWHAARQQKALARIGAAAPPARGVPKRSAETPLAHPPDWRQRGRVQMVSLDLRDRAGEKYGWPPRRP